jgi:anti-sigma B factor antagonist
VGYVVWKDVGGCAVVAISGDLDEYTVPPVRDQLSHLLQAGTNRFVVDITEVTFVDSAALGTLVAVSKAAQLGGGSFQLVVDQEWLLKSLRISSLTQVLTVSDNLWAALHHCEGMVPND